MNDLFEKYEASRIHLLDVLRVTQPAMPAVAATETLGHQQVGPHWGISSQTEQIHLKLVAPFRASPYTFLLAHLEKGSIHETSVPEDVVLQCLAGRFRVTDPAGLHELVSANESKLILAGVNYTYEALEEVYNIMRVSV